MQFCNRGARRLARVLLVAACAWSIQASAYDATDAEGVCSDSSLEATTLSVCYKNNRPVATLFGFTRPFAWFGGPGNFYWYLTVDNKNQLPGAMTKLRLEINSMGPYKDQLIAEVCGNSPIKIASPLRGQLMVNNCSQWIVIDKLRYAEPR